MRLGEDAVGVLSESHRGSEAGKFDWLQSLKRGKKKGDGIGSLEIFFCRNFF